MEKLVQLCSGVWSVVPLVFGFLPSLILNEKDASCSTAGCSLEAVGLQSNALIKITKKVKRMKYSQRHRQDQPLMMPTEGERQQGLQQRKNGNPDVENSNMVNMADPFSAPSHRPQTKEESVRNQVNIDRHEEQFFTSEEQIEGSNDLDLPSGPLDLSSVRQDPSDLMVGTENYRAKSAVSKRPQEDKIELSNGLDSSSVRYVWSIRSAAEKRPKKGKKYVISNNSDLSTGPLDLSTGQHRSSDPMARIQDDQAKSAVLKRYKCDLCRRSFTRSHNLKNHKRTHTGEKPFQCGICNKFFRQRADVKKHRRTHTGEKPYICTICTKTFAQSSNLKTHLKTHHSGA